MNDDKISVKEALEKLYDLSWMVGSTAMEYLTDKDGEKIREYIGVIEDRIYNLERSCLALRKPLVIHLNHVILMGDRL